MNTFLAGFFPLLLAGCAASATDDQPVDVSVDANVEPLSGNSYPSGCMCNYTFHEVVCKEYATGQWKTARNLGGC